MQFQYRAITDPQRPNYDGDGFNAIVDLGFSVSIRMPLRLRGIDAPELKSGDFKSQAKASKAWLAAALEGKRLTIRTFKEHGSGELDKYGRILAEVFVDGELVSLNQQLIDNRLAVAYDGRKKNQADFAALFAE
jgi:endonuclease YncB( thermonuclease family)